MFPIAVRGSLIEEVYQGNMTLQCAALTEQYLRDTGREWE